MKRLTDPRRIAGGFLFAILFAVLLGPFLHWTIQSIETTYYERAPLSNFLEPGELTVDDICFGDLVQEWRSTRQVFITNGVPAHVVRELYIINMRGIKAKIEEETAEVFIEPRTEAYAYRTATFERPLKIGRYQWVLKVTELNLPNGVVRTDYPLITSNIFEVKGCIYDPIQK